MIQNTYARDRRILSNAENGSVKRQIIIPILFSKGGTVISTTYTFIKGKARRMNEINRIKSVLGLLLFLISACQAEAEMNINNPDDIRAIEEMSAARAEAFNRGDAAAIASHFTEEGVLMAPGTPSQTGREAVEAYYQEIFDQFETGLNSYYEEVSVSGDLAFGSGIAEVELIVRNGGDVIHATSKYINILARQPDGTWLTTHDIWNDNE